MAKPCINCNKILTDKQKKNRFCSCRCAAIYNQKDGKRKCPEHQKKILSNLYKGVGFGNIVQRRSISKLTLKCEHCGKSFERLPCHKRRFCSQSCCNKSSDRINQGGYRQGSGRGKKCWYKSLIAGRVFLDSSYELEYVKFLDKNNVKWKRNLLKFPYLWKGKIRNYIPDFYLPDSNEYVEIKGYKTNQDSQKWKQFPHKLRILFRNDLKNLGLKII